MRGVHYVFTPYALLMAAVALACAALAIYAWRHRSLPAARALAVLSVLGMPWALGSGLEAAAADVPTRTFWFKFHALWDLPAATAALWFALEYADLRRLVTPPKLTLLAVPPVLAFLLILASDAHHMVWETFTYEPEETGPSMVFHAISIGYRLLVAVSTIGVYVWLSVKSPPHRAGAILCISGLLLMRLAQSTDALVGLPASHAHLCAVAFPLMAGMHAVALFKFHDYALIPVARGSIVDQMREGMLVLNTSQRILDLNPAAETMLGVPASLATGRAVSEVLPSFPRSDPPEDADEEPDFEIPFQVDGTVRRYAVHRSPLAHPRGQSVGSLILLCDVTEQRHAQAELVEQQQAVATLRERNRVARELHDSVGQLLGFVKMQAQATRELLSHGYLADADRCLKQLGAAAQDLHEDVRDYILGAEVGTSAATSFLPTLEHYLERYSATSGIAVELDTDPALREGEAFGPAVASQLLRIIQEALTNVRKHARAHKVRVQLQLENELCAEAIIEDDGAGFDYSQAGREPGQQFGLRIMRERASEIGASVCVRSEPGRGAQVVVSVPLR